MALTIEGFSVVGVKSCISERYPGGINALNQAAPNATALSDDDLWRCAFMAAADATRFLDFLEQAGLEVRQGPDSDFVLVQEWDLSVSPYCEWLQVARWDKGVIAWRSGSSPRKLVAREGWSPEHGSGLQFVSPEENDDLKLLRYDGNTAVYFDKRRNREVYVGRTQPDAEDAYRLASQVVLEHFVAPGEPALSGDPADRVRVAVADLEGIARQHPETWQIHFFLGKGKLALGDVEGAYQALQRAYEFEADTEFVPRELAGICLELGRAQEAVEIAQKAAALKPDNFETLSNLASAYVIGGRHADAATTIRAALKLKPADTTSLLLGRMIDSIASGAQPQPRNLAELSKLAGIITKSPSSQPRSASVPTSEDHGPSLRSRLIAWVRRRRT